MGLIDGDSFALPMAIQVDVVEATIDASERAIEAMKEAMANDIETHILLVSVEAGGCSGHMYDMQIIKRPEDISSFQSFVFDGITVMVHDKDSSTLNGIVLDFRV